MERVLCEITLREKEISTSPAITVTPWDFGMSAGQEGNRSVFLRVEQSIPLGNQNVPLAP